MKCVTVNISGRYFTAGGQWYYSLKEMCYSEHYVEDTLQQLEWYCSLNVVRYSEHNFQNLDHGNWTSMTIEHFYFPFDGIM